MAVLRYIALSLLLLMISVGAAEADLVPEDCGTGISLVNRFQVYRAMGDSPEHSAVLNGTRLEADLGPGRNMGGTNLGPEVSESGNWRHRRTTYEILFPTMSKLGEAVYQLALFTGDLDPSISQERFQKGAQGFHYSMTQILEWANSRARDGFLEARRGEDTLLLCLLLDGVITITEGRFFDTGRVRHVLGAAPGTKRDLALNLNHERWHVLWDEDFKFRARYASQWEALTSEQRQEVFNDLRGYALDNDLAAIEEWAVRQQESGPIW